MRSARTLHASLIAVATASLTPVSVVAQPPSPDWARMARLIVDRIAPDKGERVLLMGAPGMADELIPHLRAALREAGAQDLGALAVTGSAPTSWRSKFVDDLLGTQGLEAYLSTVDVGVMLPGAAPIHPSYAAMQRVLAASKGGRARTIHFHWAGAYSLGGTLIDITPERAAFYQRALLETDYPALGLVQREFERAMRDNEVHVTTPAGTDLRFTIGDRPVTRQDGDAKAVRARQARNLIDREIELPAGAIRVAPIEESVSGTIAFPASDWGGERVDGLMMQFDRGRVTSFSAKSGRAAVERELQNAGEAGRAFREFALGMNPLLAIPGEGERWIPYYGYGAGVVRLSLGDNSELGGKVKGGYVRWNFFTDAIVTVGREVWVRDGRLVHRSQSP